MKHLGILLLIISTLAFLVTGLRRSPTHNEPKADEELKFEDEDIPRSQHGLKVDVDGNGAESFQINVKQQQKTETKSGVKEVTKISETKKVKGGNITRSSLEIIRYPNGTKVVKGQPPKGKQCSSDKDCGANKFCGLFFRCRECKKKGSFCTKTSQCCGGDSMVCHFGQCKKVDRSGKAGSYCEKGSDCKKGLCCASGRIGALHMCKPLGKERDVCANMFNLMLPDMASIFGQKTYPAFCPCVDGLECRGGPDSLLYKRCLKKREKEADEMEHEDSNLFDSDLFHEEP